ncbi:MAG: PaaI family thioesterase [Anaerovoracaceae bacterium]
MKAQYSKRIKRKVLRKQISTTSSITCGTENPASLGCVFYELEGGEVATVFKCGRWHEGHEGIMHGGMSGAVLDEVMGRANRVYNRREGDFQIPFVTAEMTVKYLKPVLRGETMTAYGRIDSGNGRKRFASGEILNSEGEIMAAATGVYVSVDIVDTNADWKHAQMGEEPGPDDPKEL